MGKLYDLETLTDLLRWSTSENSTHYKTVRRLAITSRRFPVVVKKHGFTPDKQEYLMEFHVNSKKMQDNNAFACLLKRSEGQVNPSIIYPITVADEKGLLTDFLVTINAHALDRYAERYLKKGVGYQLTNNELIDAWNDMKIHNLQEFVVNGELQAPTECGMILGTIDWQNHEITIKTFIAQHNFYPNQSLDKRQMDTYRQKLDEAGFPRSINYDKTHAIYNKPGALKNHENFKCLTNN